MAGQTVFEAQRIMLIGSPGAGKSTLARAFAAATGLPLIHLDQLNWRAGWVEAPECEFDAALDAAVASQRWIIDGNYTASIARRLARAELVVWLDLPTRVCLWRIVRRVVSHGGRVRPDMPVGCPERLDGAFLTFVARFRRQRRPKIERMIAGYDGDLIHVKDRRAANALLRRVRPGR